MYILYICIQDSILQRLGGHLIRNTSQLYLKWLYHNRFWQMKLDCAILRMYVHSILHVCRLYRITIVIMIISLMSSNIVYILTSAWMHISKHVCVEWPSTLHTTCALWWFTIAIENGYRHSDFSMKNMVMFHSCS